MTFSRLGKYTEQEIPKTCSPVRIIYLVSSKPMRGTISAMGGTVSFLQEYSPYPSRLSYTHVYTCSTEWAQWGFCYYLFGGVCFDWGSFWYF